MPFLQASPLELYYEEAGSGEPLVLIGGITSTLEIWSRQVPALAKRYRVLTPDNRGSGRTRVEGDDGRRSMPLYAADVLALLDGLGIERCHLVGASMGGMIVQELACSYPERLWSLTIACSHPGPGHAVAAAPEVSRAMVRGSAGDASEAEREGALRAVLHPQTFDNDPETVGLYDAGKKRWPHSPAELAARLEAIAAFDAWDRLAGIPVPTLVITGEDDQLVPVENSRRIADRIPGARLALIARGAHVFFIEQAEATNRALLAFLDSLGPCLS